MRSRWENFCVMKCFPLSKNASRKQCIVHLILMFVSVQKSLFGKHQVSISEISSFSQGQGNQKITRRRTSWYAAQVISQIDPREIGFAFHRAGTEITEKVNFCNGNWLYVKLKRRNRLNQFQLMHFFNNM